jgi:chromosome condensin MukBEF complex kleisin-like MukF subunit
LLDTTFSLMNSPVSVLDVAVGDKLQTQLMRIQPLLVTANEAPPD